MCQNLLKIFQKQKKIFSIFFKIYLIVLKYFLKINCEFIKNFLIVCKFFSKFKNYFLLPPLCLPTTESLATALIVCTATQIAILGKSFKIKNYFVFMDQPKLNNVYDKNSKFIN